MMLVNMPPNARLNIVTEMRQINRVDAAVHKTEAVRRTDDRIAFRVENRALMNRYEIQIAAKLFHASASECSTAVRIIFIYEISQMLKVSNIVTGFSTLISVGKLFNMHFPAILARL